MTLSRQLKTDPDFQVRLSAGLKLGQSGDRRAVPVLTEALADRVGTVRAVAGCFFLGGKRSGGKREHQANEGGGGFGEKHNLEKLNFLFRKTGRDVKKVGAR